MGAMKWLRLHLRDVLSNLFELIGAALLITAAWTVAPALGLVVAGAALIVVGYAINAR